MDYRGVPEDMFHWAYRYTGNLIVIGHTDILVI